MAYVDGIVDAPFLNLTPGTRTGVIRDTAYDEFQRALDPITEKLDELIAELQRAEEERASVRTLRSIQRGFSRGIAGAPGGRSTIGSTCINHRAGAQAEARAPCIPLSFPQQATLAGEGGENGVEESSGPAFYEYADPLHSVAISPASQSSSGPKPQFSRTVPGSVTAQRGGGAGVCLEDAEGGGRFSNAHSEIVEYHAARRACTGASHRERDPGHIACEAEALVTITDSLMPERTGAPPRQGCPATPTRNFRGRRGAPVTIWSGTLSSSTTGIGISFFRRDPRRQQLRYIARLFVKELVLRNFPGASPPELLERMLELMLYLEKNLR